MDSCGFQWIPMDSYGFIRIPMDSYGILWIHKDFYQVACSNVTDIGPLSVLANLHRIVRACTDMRSIQKRCFFDSPLLQSRSSAHY